MSSGMYEKGVASLMAGNIDLINDVISCLLIDSDFYAPNLNNDQYQSSIPEASIIAELVLTGKTIDVTKFKADDSIFTSVTGAKVDAIIIYKTTDAKSTSELIAYIDNAPEFPITPDGTNITLAWDTDGIFEL